MNTSPREALNRLINEDPAIVERVFRIAGLEVPEIKSVTVFSVDADDIPRTIDTVLRYEDVHQGEFLVLVEAQHAKDPSKPSSWLHDIAYLQVRYDIEATFAVVCTDPEVGEWAAGPHELGVLPGTMQLRPFVLSAANVPKVTSIDDAGRDVALASLSVIVHGGDRDHQLIMEALAGAIRARDSEADRRLWTDIVDQGLGRSPAGDVWRKMMSGDISSFRDGTAQLLRAEDCVDEDGVDEVCVEERDADHVVAQRPGEKDDESRSLVL